MSVDTVLFLSAEIVLVAAALALYLGGAMARSAKPWAAIAMAGILLSAAALWHWGDGENYMTSRVCHGLYASSSATPQQIARAISVVLDGPVSPDPLAAFGRWFALAAGGILVLLTWRPLATGGTAEYLGSLLLAVAGLMLVAVAGNLILLFVGLELISIPTYILLSLGRRDPANQEAAAKYFFLSILSSAIFLYGLSFLYGTTGSVQLAAIRSALAEPVALGSALATPAGIPAGFVSLVKVALVLVIAGLCFRVTAVPFHFYAPDVYQGTIHGNAAMLSVIPKAAGLLALVRLVVIAMPGMEPHAWKVMFGLSALTMTLGNLMALWQDNLRRLMAYSSIANAGYMLIGLTVGLARPEASGWANGVAATFFYLCVYAVATLGAFAAFIHLGCDRQQIESVDELAGLGRARPAVAAAVAMCMFSLAGLPPAAGLWGKLLVFGSALGGEANPGDPHRVWLISLAIVGALNAAVAACYYLRIVAVMYFRMPLATPRAEGGRGAWVAAIGCAALVILLGVYPGPLVRSCQTAAPIPNLQSPSPNPSPLAPTP